MKHIKFLMLPMLAAALLLGASCAKKVELVADKCAVCGTKATKNYASPLATDKFVNINTMITGKDGQKQKASVVFLLRKDTTIAVCDSCNSVLETECGKSK